MALWSRRMGAAFTPPHGRIGKWWNSFSDAQGQCDPLRSISSRTICTGRQTGRSLSRGRILQLKRLLIASFRRRQHAARSEEHTSELQSLMRISYAVFCLKKKNNEYNNN